MQTIYEGTGRKFTLCLRVVDATVTRQANQQIVLTWANINWGMVFPMDIPPNSTFRCTHSFVESVPQALPVDNFGWNIRARNLISNLPANSYVSNVTNTDGSTSSFLGQYGIVANFADARGPNNPPGTFRAGFLNRMYKQMYNGVSIKSFDISKTVDSSTWQTDTRGPYGVADGLTPPQTWQSQAQFDAWLRSDLNQKYSYIRSFGGLYTCEPRTFECVNPTELTSVMIAFLDDIPVWKASETAVTINGARLQAATWGPYSQAYPKTATGGSATLAQTTGNVGGYWPSFTSVTSLVTNYSSGNTWTGINERNFDLGPPQGTHVFEFELVRKVDIMQSK